MSDQKRSAEKECRSAARCILVGLDGSAASRYALDCAAAAGAQLEVLVVAVTAFDDLAECLCGPTRPRERDLLARHKGMIADVRARHPDADISQWRVRAPLAAKLCNMARDDDLLVVPASGGPSSGSGLWAYCVDRAPCPVIVVRLDAGDRQHWPVGEEEAVADPAAWLG